MSSTRKRERAASKAVEIATRKEAKQAAKEGVQTQVSAPAKAPSTRPYREPEPAPKEKEVAARTVSERDGLSLLRKIEGKGGKDIIVMMRDSTRPPEELAADLMRDETIVISCLSHGSSKDRLRRLMAAIEQSTVYLKKGDGERPVTVGVKKLKRQVAAKEKQDEIARKRRNPKPRVLVPLTVADVLPERDDQEIVLDELKQYLELNAEVRERFTNAVSELKATRILVLNVGQRFDAKVKALLAAPKLYQDLLAEAGAIIRRELRKYDAPDDQPEGPAPTIQESPALLASRKAQQDALDNYDKVMAAKKEALLDADDPDEIERQERFNRQEAALRNYSERLAQQPS